MNSTAFDLGPEHHVAVHALNQRYATELSSLTPEQLAALIAKAVYARGIGDLDGFLVTFDQDTPHDGENFLWLKARYGHFLYVDRLAVAPQAQGRGTARALYADLIGWATAHGYPFITCEVNIHPPNPASDALHAALGFAEIGQQDLANGKRVRYLARRLRSGDEKA